jgi:hypothetical protein
LTSPVYSLPAGLVGGTAHYEHSMDKSWYREQARRLHHRPRAEVGADKPTIEVDAHADVSVTTQGGAWVQAWAWVPDPTPAPPPAPPAAPPEGKPDAP